MQIPVYVNARFLTEPLTGLQRWGREILRELDAMLEEGVIDREAYRFILLSPTQPTDLPDFKHLELQVRGMLKSHLWEQWSLPRMAKGFLLNFKNTAPVKHPAMAMVVHDLQTFARPETHTGLFNRVYNWILPRAAVEAKVVAAVSEHTASEIQRFLGIAKEDIPVLLEGHEHVLRTEADDDFLRLHGLQPQGFLLAVSSLNPNKNFAAILRAMKLAQIEVPLVIAGGTNPKVFEDADGLDSLPDDALHVGRVDDGALRALYENALGFVFPSFYEGWGLPPGEAMLLGCPVVSSNTSSLPEVCGDAVLYCDPADDESIAKQLFRLVEDGPLRQELSALGRAQSSQFTWRAAAERMWAAVEPAIRETR
ncbi:MAG: glycosyltransferase family 4 protein [Planctomycetota bacterium]|jgi:glycosyltransferase involved in cell wall biosynthesis